MSELKLQPLRIPNGWLVKKNDLFAMESEFSEALPDSEKEFGPEYFEDEIFVAVNFYNRCLIELGWYPPYLSSGNYRIRLVRPCKPRPDNLFTLDAEYDWLNAAIDFECKNRHDAIARLESLFLEINKQGYD